MLEIDHSSFLVFSIPSPGSDGPFVFFLPDIDKAGFPEPFFYLLHGVKGPAGAFTAAC